MMPALMTVEESTVALAVAFLLCAFLGSGKFRFTQLLRYYALQSLFGVGLLVSMAAYADEHLYVTALGVLLVKVIIIPFVLLRTTRRVGMSGRLTAFVRPAPSYFVSGITLMVAVVAAMSIVPVLGETDFILTVTAFAAIFMGGMMMVMRRDFYSQIVAFLTLENGVAMLIAATLGALPVIAEGSLLLVVLMAAVLMNVLARRMKELYAVEEAGMLKDFVD